MTRTEELELSFLKDLEIVRTKLKQDCRGLRNIAVELKRDISRFDDLDAALEHESMSVVVVGEVNRGKSTFLNAIIGAKVFPPAATVCTAAITRLRDGAPAATLITKENQTETIDLGDKPVEALKAVVSRKNPNAANVAAVDLWYPNRFARHGVVLIDTPGVNDPESWREKITVSAIEKADAVIFLLDAHSPVTGTETTFLRNHILGSVMSRILFVVNKSDQLTEDERERVCVRCINRLSDYCPNPKIFMVSARDALQARIGTDKSTLAQSGFIELELGLNCLLKDERVRTHFESRSQRLQREKDSIRESLDFQIASTKQSAQEVKQGVENAQGKLKLIEKSLREECSAKIAYFRKLPDEIAQEAQRAFQVAKQKRLDSPQAQAEIHAFEVRGASDELRSYIVAKLEEARRDALVVVEGILVEKKQLIRIEAGYILGQLEKKIGEARALVITMPKHHNASLYLPMDILEKKQWVAPEAYVLVGGAAAVVTLAMGIISIGTGGIALLSVLPTVLPTLIGQSVVAGAATGFITNVAVQATNAVRYRLNRDHVAALASSICKNIESDSKEVASGFVENAIKVLEMEVARRMKEENKSLEDTKRRASLRNNQLQIEQKRLESLSVTLSAINGRLPL